MNQLPENQQQPMPDFSVLRHTAITPLVSREKFAELVGIEPGVVLGWCNKGYLPTVPMGRHSLVNLAKLSQQCLEHGGAV